MNLNVHFGSDNHSGVHSKILKAIDNVNIGHEIAYGNDKYTKKAIKKFKNIFGSSIKVFFVYNGTAANILGLKNITNSFNSIICAETAHLNVHECCGPEKFTGCKLITTPTLDGKLAVDKIRPYLVGFGDEHMAQPKVISITQPTELGTTYTKNELKKLSDFAHEKELFIHVDGARLSNAAAFLDIDLREMTNDVGIDILSFGGTKNGMMYGEAVIFFDSYLSKNFEYYRKQGMQLTSKMRYISAQFLAFFENDLWLKNARHANKMAQLLKKELDKIPEVEITQKVEANMIYVIIQKKYLNKIRKKYFFHVFDEKNCEARLMCSFNTAEKDIQDFIRELKAIIKN
jgi:threonine aldolase